MLCQAPTVPCRISPSPLFGMPLILSLWTAKQCITVSHRVNDKWDNDRTEGRNAPSAAMIVPSLEVLQGGKRHRVECSKSAVEIDSTHLPYPARKACELCYACPATSREPFKVCSSGNVRDGKQQRWKARNGWLPVRARKPGVRKNPARDDSPMSR